MKKIEKIDPYKVVVSRDATVSRKQFMLDIAFFIKALLEKQNELIDEVNKLKESQK